MNKLLELKQQKTTYLTFLEEEKIIESIKDFEKYLHNLKTFQDVTEENQQLIINEINQSRQEFLPKLNKLGNKYLKEHKYSKGAICFAEIIQYASKDCYSFMNYIICLHKLKQYDLEEEFLKILETILPENNCKILKDLSNFYVQIEKIELAVMYLKKYIKNIGQDNIKAEDYMMLGMYYNELYISRQKRNIDEAYKTLDYYMKADKINPNSYEITRGTAISSLIVNDYDCAKTYWEKLFKIQPLTEADLLEYSTLCMKTEDFKNFYKYHESRYKVSKHAFMYSKINKPLWNGEDLSDKTLLINSEQGFGDTIFACGYLDKVSQLAKHVIFVVQDKLVPLLEIQNFNVDILPKSMVNLDKLNFDYYINSMSIFKLLNLDKNGFRTKKGYIKADTTLSKLYKDKYFNNDKIKIGIAYQGNKEGSRLRDICLEKFLPLDKIDGIEIYSFDMSTKEEEYKIFKNNKINILEPLLIDFSDTASMIENCDIIITTDNVILNLAGAMGKKTYGLFNWNYEFRWFGLKENDTIFYSSVIPVVNSAIDEWDKSIQKIVEQIKILLLSF